MEKGTGIHSQCKFYFRKHENGNETSIEMEILWIKAPAFNIYIYKF